MSVHNAVVNRKKSQRGLPLGGVGDIGGVCGVIFETLAIAAFVDYYFRYLPVLSEVLPAGQGGFISKRGGKADHVDDVFLEDAEVGVVRLG